MNNLPPNKARRLVFVISGAMDALLGGILLLLGFDLLPWDIARYGFASWQVILLGGVLFATGAAFVIYNLSRWEE